MQRAICQIYCPIFDRRCHLYYYNVVQRKEKESIALQNLGYCLLKGLEIKIMKCTVRVCVNIRG